MEECAKRDERYEQCCTNANDCDHSNVSSGSCWSDLTRTAADSCDDVSDVSKAAVVTYLLTSMRLSS